MSSKGGNERGNEGGRAGRGGAERGRALGPERLHWRGLELAQYTLTGVYETRPLKRDGHSLSWRVERVDPRWRATECECDTTVGDGFTGWHAWLKIDRQRFCALHHNHSGALDAAAATATAIANFLATEVIDFTPRRRA